ncbi:MAG: phosphoribosylformylglycinamidine cyclo-ligase [Deltaproteobacteria bacterium]|nr:phosphoribosylformylglycinamidine cyclo-ligase [Deltaproteobacteria bacterium]
MSTLQNVDYDTLDRAKNAFIEASRRTSRFAEKYGFIPDGRLGASANLFALDLSSFFKNGQNKLFISLVPEGLGTADDARPDDLTEDESVEFWYNIGIKTVSVMTNDAASGALQTILIGLYLPSSAPELVFNPAFMKGFLDGFVEGCRSVGCVYFSGETPQLKNKIIEGKLDIAGALFALLPPGAEPIDGSRLRAGNYIVAVESSGPHENGYTVLRRIAAKLPRGYREPLESGTEYWRACNAPSKLYTPLVQALLSEGVPPNSIENITGHGWQKIMRSRKPMRYVIEKMLPQHEIFRFVQKCENVSDQEMLSTFNCGTGMVLFFDSESQAEAACSTAARLGLKAIIAGVTEDAPAREVLVHPLGVTLKGEDFALQSG